MDDNRLKIYFIRHGMTHGNMQKRYIGITDEPLCSEGVNSIKSMRDEFCQKIGFLHGDRVMLITSPLKRCMQTAELLFPKTTPEVILQLRETDFGRFENKNYKELSEDSDYQQWIDSGGKTAFPEGESPEASKKRILEGFFQAVKRAEEKDVRVLIFIIHGGTIMTLMSELEVPKRDYYYWHISNGQCISCSYDAENTVISDAQRSYESHIECFDSSIVK